VQAYIETGRAKNSRKVPFEREGITYDANFKAMKQQRTDGLYSTKRAIHRVESAVTRPSVHTQIASGPLQWHTRPTAVASVSAITDNDATTASKHELHVDELTSGVTLDTVLYSIASALLGEAQTRMYRCRK
jgi:hypothetical protein